ncbi:MAG: LysR family transcriptional regulator [Rhodobacteraceae bacterium]|jgi:LysR family glycine cleavage system transcriptional activator|nr:LysR family transcriptional regulator [Paracoccaceae bacterium]
MQYWRNIPPLKALLAVEATARLGGFSKAATELNVTQSAVSHLVGQAERFLGTTLFERQRRPATLTPEGRRYVASLVPALNAMQAEGRRLQQMKRANTLTISCNLAYSIFWLLPRTKLFHEENPDITVNIVTAFQGLPELTDDVDLSIRFGRGGWPGCHSEFLFREVIGPVASPGYLAGKPPISEPGDLLKHELLHALAEDRSWYDWHQWFDHHAIQHPPNLPGPHFDNHLVMMQAATAGAGVALGWIGTASELVRLGQLVELLPGKIDAKGSVFLVQRSDRPRTDACVRFSRWLMRSLGDPAEQDRD